MFDPTELSDDQLARAADEYIKRTVNLLRSHGVTNKLSITIMAHVSSYDDTYHIEHAIQYGSSYDGPSVKGSNLGNLAHRAINRFHEDKTDSATYVVPQLEAPATVEAVATDVTPPPEVEDDGIPF